MMVGGFGNLAYAIDERQSFGEILELPLARDRVFPTTPLARGKLVVYLAVAKKGHPNQDTPAGRFSWIRRCRFP